MVSAGDLIRVTDLGDQTWTALTLQSGVTTIATLQYQERFGFVFLSGKVSLDAALGAGASKTVVAGGTLPGARDSMDYGDASFDGAHKFIVINVNTTGALTVFAPTALNAAAQVSFNMFYEAA